MFGIERPLIPGKVSKKAEATETAESEEERFWRKVLEVAKLELQIEQLEREQKAESRSRSTALHE